MLSSNNSSTRYAANLQTPQTPDSVIAPDHAHANSCATFEDIIQKASKNYESLPSTPNIYSVTPDLCDVALTSDGVKLYHCRWDYGYRATDAFELLRTLNTEIEQCLGVQSRKIEDGVNHPDTYEQRLYRLGEINISLSLKDKAALSQSFVSLQISGIPQ